MQASPAETPKERLKRLMAVQLNKQIQKDTLSAAQRKLAEEKDRQARLQLERAHLAAQRRMGILPERRVGVTAAGPGHPGPDRPARPNGALRNLWQLLELARGARVSCTGTGIVGKKQPVMLA